MRECPSSRGSGCRQAHSNCAAGQRWTVARRTATLGRDWTARVGLLGYLQKMPDERVPSVRRVGGGTGQRWSKGARWVAQDGRAAIPGSEKLNSSPFRFSARVRRNTLMHGGCGLDGGFILGGPTHHGCGLRMLVGPGWWGTYIRSASADGSGVGVAIPRCTRSSGCSRACQLCGAFCDADDDPIRGVDLCPRCFAGLDRCCQ